MERERDLGSGMSEVDAWVEALETAHLLSRDADEPALQDALCAARLCTMSDMDYLDPIFGDACTSRRQRLDSVLKALQASSQALGCPRNVDAAEEYAARARRAFILQAYGEWGA